MRFSLSLPLLKDLSAPDPFRETFELAVIAEEAGFDTATIGHHHFMAGNMADPLTFLAAVAARTSTLRIGTGIFQAANLPNRGLDVTGIGIGHALHRDRCSTANRDRTDHYLARNSALDGGIAMHC